MDFLGLGFGAMLCAELIEIIMLMGVMDSRLEAQ